MAAAAPVPQPLLRSVEVEPLHQSIIRFVILVVILHPQFAFDGRVPVVFDGIVRPPRQPLRNQCPLVPHPKSPNIYFLWASIIAWSSSSVHLYFLISGLRWLCHRSLHCFPMRPGRLLAMKLQFLGPCSRTSLMTSSSSSLVCVMVVVPMVL